MSMAAVFIAGLGAAVTWMALTLDPPAGLRVYMLLSGPALVLLAAAAVRIAVSVIAARLELRMDEGSVRLDTRVGRWAAVPPTIVPQQPGEIVAQLRGSIPIRHLVEVRFDRPQLGQTLLVLRSPTREIQIHWSLDAPSDHWLRARLVDGLRVRLEALGRDVT